MRTLSTAYISFTVQDDQRDHVVSFGTSIVIGFLFLYLDFFFPQKNYLPISKFK